MHRKLPLLLPLILLFGLNTSKAQTITNLRMLPTVPLFTDSILLEVTTFYPFGGGGQGPRLENPDIQQYGDTILIMGYYDFGGIWQAFMSGSIDTIALGQLTQGNYTLIYHLNSFDNYTNDTAFSLDIDTLQFYVTEPMAIKETLSDLAISLFPNPSTRIINVSGVFGDEPVMVEVFSNLGQIIYHEIISTSNSFTLDFSELPNGSHLLSITTTRGNWIQKFTLNK